MKFKYVCKYAYQLDLEIPRGLEIRIFSITSNFQLEDMMRLM